MLDVFCGNYWNRGVYQRLVVVVVVVLRWYLAPAADVHHSRPMRESILVSNAVFFGITNFGIERVVTRHDIPSVAARDRNLGLNWHRSEQTAEVKQQSADTKSRRIY